MEPTAVDHDDRYDVTLSFSGANREYVSRVSAHLHRLGVSHFYDEFEWESLWGKNLIEELDRIYSGARKHVIIFISREYVDNDLWTSIERQAAQDIDRLFRRKQQYILPARFDETKLPGLPSATACVDLRTMTPEQFAERIFRMLNRSAAGPFLPRFFEAEVPTSRARDQIQGIPISLTVDAMRIGETVHHLLTAVLDKQQDDGTWPHKENREFDLIYATSSACLFLLQAGISADSTLLRPSIDYLARAARPHVDTRAAFSVLIPTCRAPDELITGFLEELQTRQFRKGDHEGSFLLEQGPATDPDNNHWQPSRTHRDGASFHACHLSDLLLHISADAPRARVKAVEILRDLRGFFERNLREGYLLDKSDNPSPVTLFSYALLQRLSLPLPHTWMDVTMGILARLPQLPEIVRAFGVMNVKYMSDWIHDADFHTAAAAYISSTLPELERTCTQGTLSVPDLAAIGRAHIYGAAFLSGAHPY